MGGSWGVLGRPGWPRGPSWAPRGDPENMGARSGGSRGGSRSVEIRPESVFLRSQEAKYTYFQGFEHAHFVNLRWPLGSPGPSWVDLGRPWRLQSWSREGPGGPGKKGSAPRWLQGASRNQKTVVRDSSDFHRSARNLTYIGVSAICKKNVFF